MPEVVEQAALQLREAASSGVPCAPVRDVLGTTDDLDLAYEVARHNVDLDVAAGRRVSGRKIGLTSKVVQEAFGVFEPDYGVLFSDMCVGDGVDLPADRLMQPRAEAEVALVLGRDLDLGTHSVIDVIDAVAYALPSLEIVDSRIAGWDLTIVDTVADGGSSALYVVGTRPISLGQIDLVDLPMEMTINGETASTGTGGACLGNPLNAAVWLADEMCRRDDPIRAGECILTGSLGPMVPIAPGDEIVADFGPLGRVRTRYPS
ncbi:MAG: fumarylacetoacetate hydrolase family protein [Actinomycetota bacterium]